MLSTEDPEDEIEIVLVWVDGVVVLSFVEVAIFFVALFLGQHVRESYVSSDQEWDG